MHLCLIERQLSIVECTCVSLHCKDLVHYALKPGFHTFLHPVSMNQLLTNCEVLLRKNNLTRLSRINSVWKVYSRSGTFYRMSSNCTHCPETFNILREIDIALKQHICSDTFQIIMKSFDIPAV